jgi:tetratricopeptide (TPR) repeat protein
MEAYQSENYVLALEKINQAIVLNDKLAHFYQLKGDINRKLFKNQEALKAYNTAVLKRSNFAEVYESMGDIYRNQERYDEAVRAYKKVSTLKPDDLEIILKIAQCYILWTEFEVAQYHLDVFKKNTSAQNQPLSDDYFLLRGEAFFHTKDFEKSVDALKNIKYPGVETYALLGKNYYQLGDYELGVSYFSKLVSLEKEKGEWYLYRGMYFFYKKDFGDAKGQLEYALQLDDGLVESHYYLGKIYVSEGRTAEALKELILYRQKMRNSDKLEEVEEIIDNLEGPTK